MECRTPISPDRPIFTRANPGICAPLARSRSGARPPSFLFLPPSQFAPSSSWCRGRGEVRIPTGGAIFSGVWDWGKPTRFRGAPSRAARPRLAKRLVVCCGRHAGPISTRKFRLPSDKMKLHRTCVAKKHHGHQSIYNGQEQRSDNSFG